ncbi:MAG TPA: DNA replication and repair protein RecF [Candidatus Saccharimonadales bacterium]|nr:DNA replication and repair protein RecF [Candidatus Saccharimonadales bacterium]
MISDLRLQQFRSYSDASFEFGPGVNIIVGPNGSGKTNLLEAILVMARGGSYRVGDLDLVQFGATWFRLDAHLEPADQVRTVKLSTEPKPSKTYELDGKTYHRLTAQHTLPVVLFEPNHLLLLHSTPQLRRDYLDDILEQTLPGFSSFRRNYRRVLVQRNTLLKRAKPPTVQELFPWNLRLSELGATITRARAALCEQLNEQLDAVYKSISKAATAVAIAYHPKFVLESYESQLFSRLESHLQEDVVRGFTAYGPHREDFVVTFDLRAADEFASRGETRTAILALKIIELQLIERVCDQTPLLLLDDVFSELDGARRRALTSFLQTYQTFLTTTDADVVVKHFTGSTIIPLGPD